MKISIHHRKWTFSALFGLIAPLCVNQRMTYPDPICSAIEQQQAEEWQTRARRAKTPKERFQTQPLPPDCLTAQQQSYLVNHWPEASREIVWFSFCVSVIATILFGSVVWPFCRGLGFAIRLAAMWVIGRYRDG